MREIKDSIASRSPADAGWRQLYRRKLDELDQQNAQAMAARSALAHGLACTHQDIVDCPKFTSGDAALLAGSFLEEAHSRVHSH